MAVSARLLRMMFVAVVPAIVACGRPPLGADGGGAGNGGGAGAGGAAAATGIGGAAGTIGPSGAAGAAGAAGTGGASPPDCVVGDVFCAATGHRMRCGANGTWINDNYVCTTALAGSTDMDTMCALKADGRLGCWSAGEWANGEAWKIVTKAPAATWKWISVREALFDVCAIDVSGAVSCWSSVTGALEAPPGRFSKISFTIDGTCAISEAGIPSCFGGTRLPSTFVGRFRELVTANFDVYGIDENDQLHVPSPVQPSYPAGNYWQVVVNNSASCALRYDGAIFCFSYPPEKVRPPPAEADFVNVALTYVYENACALRNDHTVTCWKGMSDAQPLEATPAGTFTSLAGTRQAMCGIRTDGTTTCWGTPGRERLVPPDGW